MTGERPRNGRKQPTQEWPPPTIFWLMILFRVRMIRRESKAHTVCKTTAFVSRLSRERIELDRGSGGHQFESCTVAVGSPRKQRARQKALPVTDHLVLLARVR